MKSWVKLYTEINRDADMGTLTWAQRGIWSAFLALAGQIDDRDEEDDETGALDTPGRVAWHLRLSQDELDDALAAFTERGMVDERDGILYLTNYPMRQQVPPSQRRPAQRDRQRAHRADAQCHNPVTTLSRDVTPSETESDADADADAERGDAVRGRTDAQPSAPDDVPFVDPPAADPEPKRTSRADPRTKHPAVACVKGITGRLPNRALYGEVIQTLGEHPDGKKAATCYQEWVKRGFNPNAMTWLTEWYPNGIPKQGNPGRPRAPADTEVPLEAFQAQAAKEARAP